MSKYLWLLCFLLTAPFLAAQDWQTDFNRAKEMASNENKNILLVFSGSDWCAPCIKLKKEILTSEEFIVFAKEHYIILNADFPKRKVNALPKEQQEHNKALAERYNKQGHFPLVVVLDAEGTVVCKTGYLKMSPSEYIAHLTALND